MLVSMEEASIPLRGWDHPELGPRQPLTYILKPHMLELSADVRLPQDSNLGLLADGWLPQKTHVPFCFFWLFFFFHHFNPCTHVHIAYVYIYVYV